MIDPDRSFDLVETMRFDPHDGIADIERHLSRMKASADMLGFAFDRHGARNELQAATFHLRTERKVRLLLSATGAVSIEVRDLPRKLPRPAEVAIALLPEGSEDLRYRHRASGRASWDEARERAGTFEILFEEAGGYLTRGSFTHVFVAREGGLVTPPLSRALSSGVLRERLIASGEAVEGDLVAADLVRGFFVGNALLGLVPALLAD